MKLGQLIKQQIKEKGITQKELCSKIGISQTALSQIVKGVYKPSWKTLNSICETLDLQIEISFSKKNIN